MSADPHGGTNDADELDPDEPKTPLWMPLLGLALFLLGLVYVLTQGDEAGQEAPADDRAQAAAGDGETADEAAQ